MEQHLIEAEKRQDEVEKCINKAIEDWSLAEELCSDVEEREQKGYDRPLDFPATNEKVKGDIELGG